MSDVGLYSLDENNIVRFSLKNLNRRISGPEEAVQLVAACMFTEPGSCLFDKDAGGGALKFKRENMPMRTELRADAAIVVRQTMETVRRSQRAGRPANSTVVGIDLVDARPDVETQTVFLKIRIRLQDGNSFAVAFQGVAS